MGESPGFGGVGGGKGNARELRGNGWGKKCPDLPGKSVVEVGVYNQCYEGGPDGADDIRGDEQSPMFGDVCKKTRRFGGVFSGVEAGRRDGQGGKENADELRDIGRRLYAAHYDLSFQRI